MGGNKIFQIFFLLHTMKFCVELENNSFLMKEIETKVQVVKG
jgi:hypothetical protein